MVINACVCAFLLKCLLTPVVVVVVLTHISPVSPFPPSAAPFSYHDRPLCGIPHTHDVCVLCSAVCGLTHPGDVVVSARADYTPPKPCRVLECNLSIYQVYVAYILYNKLCDRCGNDGITLHVDDCWHTFFFGALVCERAVCAVRCHSQKPRERESLSGFRAMRWCGGFNQIVCICSYRAGGAKRSTKHTKCTDIDADRDGRVYCARDTVRGVE